ncbi:hypothetical protein Dda_1438 [Drechslerella dactyloides]|uniref:N-acetyltransferase domain-containing protein n=1 Tax=Drechslerella dactyloides TaxID=74499 RepID=A0AAD6J2F8_DREDA|nr:hypothetical protein Dda_1438 [Drechslerella dactyloides]
MIPTVEFSLIRLLQPPQRTKLAAMMPYLNTAEGSRPTLPVDAYHLRTPAEEYDLNCVLPLRVLESNGVRLEPFIPSLHAEYAFSLLQDAENSQLYRYLPYGPFATLPEFLTWLEQRIRSDRNACLFLITDLSRPLPEGEHADPMGRVAGWIGLLNISLPDLVAEVGHVTVLRRAWKTHVNTHASSLLLQYLLSAQPSGLALRRVSWLAHGDNENSNAAAQRLGFVFEGTVRCAKLLREDKDGGVVDSVRGFGRAEEGKFRDTNVWSVTWEDWERKGTEGHVAALLAREVKPAKGWKMTNGV